MVLPVISCTGVVVSVLTERDKIIELTLCGVCLYHKHDCPIMVLCTSASTLDAHAVQCGDLVTLRGTINSASFGFLDVSADFDQLTVHARAKTSKWPNRAWNIFPRIRYLLGRLQQEFSDANLVRQSIFDSQTGSSDRLRQACTNLSALFAQLDADAPSSITLSCMLYLLDRIHASSRNCGIIVRDRKDRYELPLLFSTRFRNRHPGAGTLLRASEIFVCVVEDSDQLSRMVCTGGIVEKVENDFSTEAFSLLYDDLVHCTCMPDFDLRSLFGKRISRSVLRGLRAEVETQLVRANQRPSSKVHGWWAGWLYWDTRLTPPETGIPGIDMILSDFKDGGLRRLIVQAHNPSSTFKDSTAHALAISLASPPALLEGDFVPDRALLDQIFQWIEKHFSVLTREPLDLSDIFENIRRQRRTDREP